MLMLFLGVDVGFINNNVIEELEDPTHVISIPAVVGPHTPANPFLLNFTILEENTTAGKYFIVIS